MSRLVYATKKFKPATLDVIADAISICSEYQAMGFDLTLRQLYYQFVSRGLIPNNDREYKRLGSIINDARLAGYLDWDYIVDRTRSLRTVPHWETPADIIRSAAHSFRMDKWRDQRTQVEVWIEKDALVGVIEGVCQTNDVPHFSCRGYVSQSEQWAAGQRIFERALRGQRTVVLHLGDHDPSGIDMTRDIRDRLNNFVMYDSARHLMSEVDVALSKEERHQAVQVALGNWLDDYEPVVQRIALTMDQVEEFDPPPNPTKLTDARAESYLSEYGQECWELDALDPVTLSELIQSSIDEHRDPDLWEDAVERERVQRERLATIASEFSSEA